MIGNEVWSDSIAEPGRYDLLGVLMVALDRLLELGVGEDDEAVWGARLALASSRAEARAIPGYPWGRDERWHLVTPEGALVSVYLRLREAGLGGDDDAVLAARGWLQEHRPWALWRETFSPRFLAAFGGVSSYMGGELWNPRLLHPTRDAGEVTVGVRGLRADRAIVDDPLASSLDWLNGPDPLRPRRHRR